MASKFIYEVDDMAEGVYMASGASLGDDCWVLTGIECHQTPETGRPTYCIKVDAYHKANHSCSNEILTVTFNQAVEFKDFEGNQPISGNGTAVLRVPCGKDKNGSGDSLGMGGLYVYATTDLPLEIKSAYINDEGYRK